MIEKTQANYERKTFFKKFITSTNTSEERRGKMIWGMGPQFVGNITGHGPQNKHHGNQPGSYKRKRNIAKASRRRNRK